MDTRPAGVSLTRFGALLLAYKLARWTGRRTPHGVAPRRLLTERQVVKLLAAR